ncbi:MAG: DUF1801 domain-containing protein [Anaerolineae bacterium]|nr:DUF1801 domain-containing protein [Anaerolineae bacterium]
MSDAVNDYIETINQSWQIAVCRQLDQTIRKAVPDVEARIQYKKPHYLKGNKYAAVFGTAKGWVSFTIFNATDIQPPVGLFEASENGDRITLKIHEGQAVDYEQLGDLLKQAVNTLA